MTETLHSDDQKWLSQHSKGDQKWMEETGAKCNHGNKPVRTNKNAKQCSKRLEDKDQIRHGNKDQISADEKRLIWFKVVLLKEGQTIEFGFN